jgi:hypothetical protein
MLSFDIPSQPLANALKAYGEIVPTELFYDSAIVTGLRSAPVRGTLDPQAALRLLLDRTGLVATSLAPGTVTILPLPKSRDRPDLAEIQAKLSPFLPYLGQVQDGIRSALCQDAALGADSTEVLVRLWLAPSGAVSSVAFFSQTGSPVSNPAYAAVLTRLVFGQPPSDMPQPVTMVLLPRTSPQVAGCDHG